METNIGISIYSVISTASATNYTSGNIALFVSNLQKAPASAAATFSHLAIYPAQGLLSYLSVVIMFAYTLGSTLPPLITQQTRLLAKRAGFAKIAPIARAPVGSTLRLT